MKFQTPIKLHAADKRKLKQKVKPVTDKLNQLKGWVPKVTVIVEKRST